MEFAIPPGGPPARILVVDDDPMLVDLLAEWVKEKWDCESATGGEEALATIDDSFDVVLLDRQMPDLAGEKVLHTIRERGLDVRVLMVSAVEPDFDLLDLPIDDYLRKPVDRPALQATVEGLLLRRTFHDVVEQFFACGAKLDVLEAAKPATALAANSSYLALKAKADELRQSVDATLGRRSELASTLPDGNADD